MRFSKWQIFLLSIAVILVGILLFQLLFVPEKDPKLIAKLIAVLVTYIIAIFRALNRPGIDGRQIYEAAYQDILEDVFPDDKRSYRTLLDAITLYNKNKFQKALKQLTALEKTCPTNKERTAVLLFQALCYSGQGLTDDAIASYKTLLYYDNTSSRAWSNLGLQYANAGRSEDAEHAYRNAIRCDSQNAASYAILAVLLLSKGDTEQAIAEALHAFSLNTKLYQPLSTVAIAYAKQGDAENARKYLNLYAFHGGDKDALVPQVEALLNG